MNERERFRNLFRGDPVDRPPLLEEGVRERVIRLWHEQGMPAGLTHLQIFGLTPHESVGPDIESSSLFSGGIAVLSEKEYRRAFAVTARRFPGNWRRTVARLEKRDHIVCIWASRGFFQALGVEDWPTLRHALVCMVRNPVKVRCFCAIYGDFCAAMLEMALRDLDPEFVYLSEPVSDNKGPLISPAMFEEFMIPAYEKIIAAAQTRGRANIVLSTYGNSLPLFPALIQAGITALWISEAAETPDLDYRNLRRRFGPGLGLIGGVPLGLLRGGAVDQIDARLREIVAPLLREGSYIPLASGRIREEIPWQVYKSYRESLAAIIAQSNRRAI